MDLVIVEKYTQLFGNRYVWAPKIRDDHNEVKKNLNRHYLEQIGASHLPTGVWFLPECHYLIQRVGDIYVSELKKRQCSTQKGATDIYRSSLTLCCMEIIKEEFGEAAISVFPKMERFFDNHKTSKMTFSFEMVVSAYLLAYSNSPNKPEQLLWRVFDYINARTNWADKVGPALQSFALSEMEELFPSTIRT